MFFLFRSEINIEPENIVAGLSKIDQCIPFVSQTSLSSRQIVRNCILFMYILKL